MKEQKIRFPGKAAQKFLLRTLPIMILLAFLLLSYVISTDGATLLQEQEKVLLFLETIGRIAVCLGLGTVLTDYAEKRTSEYR